MVDNSSAIKLALKALDLSGEVDRLKEENNSLRWERDMAKLSLRALLDWASAQECAHEDTHREGFIWEVCDQCGRKWSDDEGGRPEYEVPEPLRKAESILRTLEAAK